MGLSNESSVPIHSGFNIEFVCRFQDRKIDRRFALDWFPVATHDAQSFRLGPARSSCTVHAAMRRTAPGCTKTRWGSFPFAQG